MKIYVGTAVPNGETPYVIERGDKGWPVFALQRGLVTLGYPVLIDGDFGPKTEAVVKGYQSDSGLAADGKAGPITQGRIVRDVDAKVYARYQDLPKGLLRGFAESEGGNLLGAVNWSVSGGVDCGIMQSRVYGPPYSQDRMRYAFAPGAAFAVTANTLLERYAAYRRFSYTASRPGEYGLRCASLSWNWPYAADQYAKYGALPDPNRQATWVPAGVRFPDGTAVVTWRDWAEYYSMGGLHGEGRVTRYAVW